MKKKDMEDRLSSFEENTSQLHAQIERHKQEIESLKKGLDESRTQKEKLESESNTNLLKLYENFYCNTF
jgi:hypothetical protein